MVDTDRDTLMRLAAFDHVRKLGEMHDHLTAIELKPGFMFQGERIPFINLQQSIFKPHQGNRVNGVSDSFRSSRRAARIWKPPLRAVRGFEPYRKPPSPDCPEAAPDAVDADEKSMHTEVGTRYGLQLAYGGPGYKERKTANVARSSDEEIGSRVGRYEPLCGLRCGGATDTGVTARVCKSIQFTSFYWYFWVRSP